MTQEKNIRFHTRLAIQSLNSAMEDAKKDVDTSQSLEGSTLEHMIGNARDQVRDILVFLETMKGNHPK